MNGCAGEKTHSSLLAKKLVQLNLYTMAKLRQKFEAEVDRWPLWSSFSYSIFMNFLVIGEKFPVPLVISGGLTVLINLGYEYHRYYTKNLHFNFKNKYGSG